MDTSYLAALCIAASELLPAQKSDLSQILRDENTRSAFIAQDRSQQSSELVSWLTEEIEFPRVEHWLKQVERVASDLGAYPVFVHTDDYPRALATCWDAPPVLFVRGWLTASCAVAIVGSRTAAPEALDASRGLATEIAKAGATVVSGLAAGVDTAAHQGTLEAGGHTVAVMGTGISRVFPEGNQELAEDIAQAGALISQFSPNATRTGTTFLWRNSVIAGLADVNVVMSGEERSGSRHQAEQAIRYGRHVLLWSPALVAETWAQEAVALGSAKFFDSNDEVLECLQAVAR